MIDRSSKSPISNTEVGPRYRNALFPPDAITGIPRGKLENNEQARRLRRNIRSIAGQYAVAYIAFVN